LFDQRLVENRNIEEEEEEKERLEHEIKELRKQHDVNSELFKVRFRQLDEIRNAVANLEVTKSDEAAETLRRINELTDDLKSKPLPVLATPSVTPLSDKSYIPKVDKRKYGNIKIDHLPKLSGNLTENFDDWIFQIDSFKNRHGIDDEDLLEIITHLFRGDALQSLKKYQKSPNCNNWGIFRQQLFTRYYPRDKQRKLRSQLRNLRQVGRFEDFAYKFQVIANQIDNFPEDELVYTFVDALKPSIQLELFQAKPRTLEEAMALANEIEECIEGTKKNYHHENNLMKKVNFVRTQIPKAPGANTGIRKYWKIIDEPDYRG